MEKSAVFRTGIKNSFFCSWLHQITQQIISSGHELLQADVIREVLLDTHWHTLFWFLVVSKGHDDKPEHLSRMIQTCCVFRWSRCRSRCYETQHAQLSTGTRSPAIVLSKDHQNGAWLYFVFLQMTAHNFYPASQANRP